MQSIPLQTYNKSNQVNCIERDAVFTNHNLIYYSPNHYLKMAYTVKPWNVSLNTSKNVNMNCVNIKIPTNKKYSPQIKNYHFVHI